MLFNIVMDEMLREVEREENDQSTTLVFADDIMVWGEDAQDVQEKIDRWDEVTRKYGLRMSREKSEAMVMSRDKKARNVNIRLGGEALDVKEEFRYLGSIVTNEARMGAEITRRIHLASGFYQSIRKLLWNEDMPAKCKMLLYKTYFIPILTYGAVTWSLTNKEVGNLQAAEMKFLRSIAGVSKMEKLRSCDIRKKLGVESLHYKIGRDRLRWYGHLRRMNPDRVPRREFERARKRESRRGRPRAKWEDQVKWDVEERGEEWRTVTTGRWWEDRERWRDLVERHQPEEIEEEDEGDVMCQDRPADITDEKAQD